MEDVIVPGWLIWLMGIFMTVVIPWLVFLTNKVFDSDKAIAVNSAHDISVSDKFIELKQQITDVRSEFNTRFDRFEDRIFSMMNK